MVPYIGSLKRLVNVIFQKARFSSMQQSPTVQSILVLVTLMYMRLMPRMEVAFGYIINQGAGRVFLVFLTISLS